MFRRNVGGMDRVLRITLGGIFFLGGLLLLTGKAKAGITIAVIGLLVLLTGLVRFCLLYIPFGISTARSSQPQMKQGCNCGVFMKELPAEPTEEGSHAQPQQDVTDAMTTGQRR